MGLLDTLTGGNNKAAKNALNQAYAAFSNIQAPTLQDLSLPELQKYVQAGILTPAEAQTMLQKGNSYNDIKVDPSSMMQEQDALSKLKNVSDSNGMDDTMKAQLTQALDQVATNTHGTNASILDQMAQRGIPTSLMGSAAMMANAGDEARNANLTATQSAGQAEQNAINAMMNEGNLASSMHGQQYSEEANKAAAENAMREWNAGASNATSEANAGRQQVANQYNTATGQDVSNQNVTGANQRTAYNATVPQSMFNNQISIAQGKAGVNQAQANQATAAGNQMMGLIGAGVGAASNAFAPGASAVKKPPVAAATGALIPGQANVAGDSPLNDRVHALLSPGEGVIPRSIMNSPDAPDRAKNFVNHLLKNKPTRTVHEDDVQSVLKALTKMREGETKDLNMNDGMMTVKKGPEYREPFYKPPTSNSRIVLGANRG